MTRTRGTWIAILTLATLALASGSTAIDGGSASTTDTEGEATYYEASLGATALDPALESNEGGLPGALHVVDAAGGVSFARIGETGGQSEWELLVEMAERPHERVEAVYDLVLAVPLPADAFGRAAFRPLQFGITAREGSLDGSVALVYGGEKLVLKRNVALERSWLPLLVGAPDGLPDLEGSGHAFTLWDAIVRYDPARGTTVQGWATLRYATDAGVAAPDPSDPRFAAYLITWIPTLDPSLAPFTLRLDLRESER